MYQSRTIYKSEKAADEAAQAKARDLGYVSYWRSINPSKTGKRWSFFIQRMMEPDEKEEYYASQGEYWDWRNG